MARERVEYDVVGNDRGGSKAFKDVGDAADKAADKVDDLGKASAKAGDEVDGLGDKASGTGGKVKDSGDKATDAGEKYRGLARDIEQVEGNIRRLAEEIDRTGNKDLIKDVDRQKRELRKLTRIQDLLPDMDKAGDEAARGFGASFVTRIGPVLASAPMGPAGAAIGGALAVTVVPTVAAAIGGAVVGGIGIGGVVGGVVLASKDARVRQAGKHLGEAVMGDLEESASRFVSPTIAGIGIIRTAWDDVAGDVDALFESTARYVEPLAEGVGDFIRELMPGIRDAAEAAGPVIREISEGLPRVGRALSDLFSGFADDADAGASALRAVFIAVEEGIGFVGGAVSFFSDMYRILLDIGDAGGAVADILWGWNPIFSGPIDEGRAKIAELKGALDKGGDAGKDAGDKIGDGLQKADDKATDSLAALREWRAELDRMTGTNLSARQAQRDLEAAIDDATAAVKENGKTAINHGAELDINTAKGRANAAALDKIAKEANNAYDAILEQTGSQDLANAAADRGRAKFIELARKMGLSESAAATLADELLRIKDRKVTVTANTQPALEAAKGIVARINNMHARISVSARGTTSYGGSAHTGDGYSTGMSDGGMVTGTGPKGVDSEWRLLAPGEGVLSDDEIDALGGPSGFARLRAAIRTGQGYSGAAASASQGPSQPALNVEDLYRAFVRALQTVPVTRIDSGRTADLYARGG
ncbi:hypothetical protein [Micromonospora sp. CB01531]|uniref:hypothetical protein n=1 Tax=Micromonospora sp. CB01531 TaxID=1718947 RepID=UPI00093F0B8D|nr:hypothetical protein [Micromonospora sp. CB01531]OKI47310.1 hypothetical protein A6A27_10710 [Micromonospora sp. CB01531]